MAGLSNHVEAPRSEKEKDTEQLLYNECYIVFTWENWGLTDFLSPKETFLPRRLRFPAPVVTAGTGLRARGQGEGDAKGVEEG